MFGLFVRARAAHPAFCCFVSNNHRGAGDLHDPDYTDYGRSVQLTPPGLYSEEFSAKYSLTLYPSDPFFDAYHTSNPKVAAGGAVVILLLTSVYFILYDIFVRQEVDYERKLLKAKRTFVRFISHEVRVMAHNTRFICCYFVDQSCRCNLLIHLLLFFPNDSCVGTDASQYNLSWLDIVGGRD